MTKPNQSLVLAEFSKFGLPPAIQLQQSSVVKATISKMIAFDEAVAAFHHQMVYGGICRRYEFALAVAADKKALAAFQRDERIKSLARPPKDAADILRSLFNATYGDPKKASKYYKRIEPFWEKRRPVKAVFAFLQKAGLSDPPPKALPAPPSSPCETSEDGGKAPPTIATSGGNNTPPREPSQIINKKDPPGGSIGLWPGKAKIGSNYKLKVEVFKVDDDWVTFELLEVPELLV